MNDVAAVPFNRSQVTPSIQWPNGAKSALFIGFDVDGETAWFGNNPANLDRLVTLSHGGWDGRVGIMKILELLSNLTLPATFFIPGWTAIAHQEQCKAIVSAGHEIAHHGYYHKRPDRGAFDEAKEEIDRGFEALDKALGIRPTGYRAPSGENFPELLEYLHKSGIEYSSSFRDDFRPYRHVLLSGKPGPIEIPVNYAFDDWNFGMTSRVDPRPIFNKEQILKLWIDEFDATHEWGGCTTMVLHPQVSGRPMRWHLLREFLEYAKKKKDLWIATGAEIAEHFKAAEK